MKISNVINFIITLAIIFCLTGIIPFMLYKNANHIGDLAHQGEDPEFSEKYIENFSKLLSNEALSEDVRLDVANLVKSAQAFDEEKIIRYNNAIICMYIISAVFIIAFGIVIFKLTKYKSIGLGILAAGILSSATYILIYSFMINNVILF